MTSCPHCGIVLRGVTDAFCPECRGPLNEPPDQPATPQEQQRRRVQQKHRLWQIVGGLGCVGAVITLLRGEILAGALFLVVGLIVLGQSLRRAQGEQ
jgi:hypothetical protein